jgi:hypothetical protein
MPGLRQVAAPEAGRLLRVLLLWQRALPTHSGAQGLLLDLPMRGFDAVSATDLHEYV